MGLEHGLNLMLYIFGLGLLTGTLFWGLKMIYYSNKGEKSVEVEL